MSTIMKSAFISVAVVNAIFIISTTSLYIIRRQHREISQTSHTLNIVQAFSTLTLSTSNLLYIAWHRSYPGFVSFWLISIFTLLWILCIFGKAMRLVLLYRWNLHALSVSEGLCQRIELARRHPDPRIRMTQVVAAVAAPSGFTINERSKTALVPLDVKPFSKAKVKRNDHEIEAYPEMRFHQKLVWSMGLALLAQVIGCFTLQVMLPNPVSIFPMTAGDDSSSLFVTHLLSTYIILFLYLVLFTPIFIYLLKDMRDANGMRFDMMATLIMGIPILLLWVIFLILFYVKAIPQTLLCNLLVEFMPTVLCIGAHITSVVLPLIWTHTAYSIVPMECESRWDSGWRNWFSNKKKKTQSAWESSAAEVVMGQARGSPISLLHNTASSSPLLHPSSTSIGKCTPLHLTVEDFARVMHDIELYSKFKRFAARDLSMDCILLHESYLALKVLFDVLVDGGEVPTTGIITTQANGVEQDLSLAPTQSVTLGRDPINLSINTAVTPVTRTSMLQRPATVPTYSNSTSEEFRDSLNIRMSLPRASFILRVPENSQFTPILSPRVSTPISTLPRANIPAPIAVSPNLPPPPPTLVKTLKWSELNAPAWSVVSHSHNVWETFLKADAPVEASSVSKDSRRFVEANLARGIYTVDMLDAIEQQNVDIMFWEIYPKFMRAYNLDRLHRYGIL